MDLPHIQRPNLAEYDCRAPRTVTVKKSYGVPMKTHLSERRHCTSKHHGIAVLEKFLHHLRQIVVITRRVLSRGCFSTKKTRGMLYSNRIPASFMCVYIMPLGYIRCLMRVLFRTKSGIGHPHEARGTTVWSSLAPGVKNITHLPQLGTLVRVEHENLGDGVCCTFADVRRAIGRAIANGQLRVFGRGWRRTSIALLIVSTCDFCWRRSSSSPWLVIPILISTVGRRLSTKQYHPAINGEVDMQTLIDGSRVDYEPRRFKMNPQMNRGRYRIQTYDACKPGDIFCRMPSTVHVCAPAHTLLARTVDERNCGRIVVKVNVLLSKAASSFSTV